MTAWIEDGYNRKAKIGSWTIFYRPALRAERENVRYRIKSLSKNRAFEYACQWVASHVKLWDVTDKDAEPDDIARLDASNSTLADQLFNTIQGVAKDSSSLRWVDEEPLWRKNLHEGLKLEIENPRLARRSCEDCKKYWYNENTGLVILDHLGGKTERYGETLCQTETGCRKGTPENQKSFLKANKWAWNHYQKCAAVGHFPDDDIVKENAIIIQRALAK